MECSRGTSRQGRPLVEDPWQWCWTESSGSGSSSRLRRCDCVALSPTPINPRPGNSFWQSMSCIRKQAQTERWQHALRTAFCRGRRCALLKGWHLAGQSGQSGQSQVGRSPGHCNGNNRQCSAQAQRPVGTGLLVLELPPPETGRIGNVARVEDVPWCRVGAALEPLAQQVGCSPGLVINLQCHPRHAYGHLQSARTCIHSVP